MSTTFLAAACALLLATVRTDSGGGGGDPSPAPEGPPRTRVVLLGTGTPVPDPRRSGPAVAVVVDDVPYLVDCGPGIVRRAAAAQERGVRGLDPTRLERVFVTHLHSDHTTGLADLLLTPWVVGRREPLSIWGPPGVAEMARHVRAAYAADIAMRTEGREQKDAAGSRFVAHEIEPGVVHEDERVRVEAIAVAHGSWEHAFAFRFTTPDRTVLVSGDVDASRTPALLEAARGVDVLVHEVHALAGFERAPESFRDYHGSFHTSTRDLAELAAAAEPKLLVLYHQLHFGATEEGLLAEVRAHYDGEVVSGADLDVY